jgi:hypothetical protein
VNALDPKKENTKVTKVAKKNLDRDAHRCFLGAWAFNTARRATRSKFFFFVAFVSFVPSFGGHEAPLTR